MKIILARHGKLDFPWHVKVKAAELADMVEAYNAAAVLDDPKPSEKLLTLAAESPAVVCSSLPRSIRSAEMLGVREIALADPLFREFELPHARWPVLRVTPYTWAVIFRLLSVMGFSSNGESFMAARARARQCAQRLAAIAAEEGSVLFVGHGFINIYIAKELQRNGWVGPPMPGKQFWGYGIYELEAT